MENLGNVGHIIGDAESLIERSPKTIKEKLFGWVTDNYDKAFLIILLAGIIIRLYFFFITKGQAAWWDASDYLTQAKLLAGILDVEYIFNPRRPFFLAVLWSLLLRVGFTEISFRFTEVLFSIAAIPGMYLVGKSIFNKKVGLISAALISIFYLQLFFTYRFMTEIPTMTFFIFAMYFFWEGYVKKRNKMLLWFGVFLGLSLLTRGGTSVLLLFFPVFLFVTERFRFLKNKHLWLSFLIAFLILSLFFVFILFKNGVNPITHFLALTPETGQGQGRFGEGRILVFSVFMAYIKFMPTYFGIALLIPFLLGLGALLFRLSLNLDFLFKDKNPKLKKDFFLILWAAIPFLFHSFLVSNMEPRYLMMSFPPLFMILSNGLLQIGNWMKKYGKHLGIIVIILFLAFGVQYQLKFANNLIESKAPSYLEVKTSGEWIKANSQEGDIIFSASVPQHVYYAEREVHNYIHQGVTQEEFEEKVQELKPTFLVVSIFEPHSQWIYEYPQTHTELLTPVQAYQQGEQPLLIIYKFNYIAETETSSSKSIGDLFPDLISSGDS